MAAGSRVDPFRSYNFAVEVEGLHAGGFSEVSGLELDIEYQEYREGGVNTFMHRRAGPAKYPSNLVLKRGMTDGQVLWQWYWDVVQGMIDRKNVSILLMDQGGQERLRWNFEKAYPVKWVGPDMRAGSSEVAIESIELAHKGLMGSGMIIASQLAGPSVAVATLSVSVGGTFTASFDASASASVTGSVTASVQVAAPTASLDIDVNG